MKINDIYEVIIESIDDIGNGVTRINNIVVFVPYTLSNEKVKIKIVSVSKRFAVGKVIEFITKSDSAKTVNNKTGIEDLDIPINIIDE